MNIYSQQDSRWANEQLGTCSTNLKNAGCFVSSLGMIAEMDPPTVNRLLREKGGYTQGCMIVEKKACEILGLKYEGRTTTDPKRVCIAETDHYKAKNIPQHFFVWLGNGRIVDSWDGKEKVNPYHIVTYRLISKEKTMGKIEQIITPEYLDNNLKRYGDAIKLDVTPELMDAFDGWRHVKPGDMPTKKPNILEAIEIIKEWWK